MKKALIPITCILAILMSGCTTSPAYYSMEGSSQKRESQGKAGRMLIWKASLSVEVADVKASVQQAADIVTSANGYIERKSDHGDKSTSLTLRVPSNDLKEIVEKIAEIGTVTSRYLSSKDVTEEYIDVEARLKNKIVLRDRLQKLLDKAEGVKDVLAIEKELNRVQGDIDSMQGRLKSLKGSVDLAELDVQFRRKKILGPVGYLFKGIWWGVEKLFIIQE